MIEKVLVVDDDSLSREFLVACFRDLNLETHEAACGEDGLERADSWSPDLVVTDLRMPGMDGMELVQTLKKRHPNLPVIVVTAHGTVESAVKAMRLGAADFLLKPCSPDHIEVVMKNLQRRDKLEAENELWRREALGRVGDQQYWIGASPASKKLLDATRQVARTKATVLIVGESGTGKERLAAFLHACSPRAHGPYLKVNCAALPENLLESELFGHEKGAFTGAVQKKPGRFELAHGGTLLLDEIGELALSLQAKLLRVLEEEEFERVGGTRTQRVDVRVIASTNRNLSAMVRQGAFREDLYYRLNVVPLNIPPLRERREDIASLAQHFLKRYAHEYGAQVRDFSPEVLEMFAGYRWPGNVRELENMVQRLVVRGTEMLIEPEQVAGDLQDEAGMEREAREEAGNLVGRPLEEIEREAILATLSATGWNKTEASKILGVTARTISNKIKIYKARGFVAT